MVNRVFIKHIGRNCCFYYLFNNVFSYLLKLNFGSVLRRNNNGIHSDGAVVFVILNRYLTLAVGSEISELAAFTNLSKLCTELMSQRNGHGHKLGRFIAGKAEHHSLIARAEPVNTHGNIVRLLVESGDNRAGVAVKAVFGIIIADIIDNSPCDFGNINLRACGYFAHNHNHARCAAALAGNSAVRVFCKNCVKHGVGNLVTDFVGMTSRYRLGSKKVMRHFV